MPRHAPFVPRLQPPRTKAAELELLLTHARDLTERLSRALAPSHVAATFNLLAGELWLEVDRFEEARAAFERAVKADASPIASVGLARALARLAVVKRRVGCARALPEDAA